jgi:hypothetical protein
MTLHQTKKQIIQWGGITIFIYLIYVIAFPLIPYIYYGSLMLDMEMILRDQARWFIWGYMLGLLLLFFSFYKITKLAHEFSKQNETDTLKKYILGIGIISGIILLFLYPITALDVALYVVFARNWVLYGGNPFTTPPETFISDPYIHLTGEYVTKTSSYGPIWEIVASIPIRLGITEIASAIIATKIISLSAYLFMAWLIGWKWRQKNVSQVTTLSFFALNPLVMLEAIGNGHNDMLMIAFITLGIILFQNQKWVWATIALTIACLIKIPALIFMPIFGLAVLSSADSFRTRLFRGFVVGFIFLSLFFIFYRLMAPIPDVFAGVIDSFSRRSFSPAYALHVIVREFNPEFAKSILANTGYVFILIYIFILIQFMRKKLTLLEAGFAAYLAQIFLSNAFRIWYPLWLIPFAVLNLNSKTYWRVFLFSLAVEFSILSYYILWRWHWRNWEWGLTGPLAPYWNYFTIMTPFTVSWTFTLPFLADVIGRWKNKKKFENELWL